MPQSIAPTEGPVWVSRFQVFLLALTGLVLSLASGWTTWLGMTNFTHESLLSLMITFGIQGVMMVLSWVLGSRLASARAIGRAAQSIQDQPATSLVLRTLERLLVIAIVLLVLNLIAWHFELFDVLGLDGPVEPASVTMFAGISLALLAVLVLIPYGPVLIDGIVQAFVTGTRNLVVISMLMACLFASVFFSFDSLFSRILPDDERRRIADFRSRSVVMDIRSSLQALTLEEYATKHKALFTSAAWSKYNSQLEEITAALGAVAPAVDAQISRDKRKQHQSESRQSAQAARIEAERGQLEQSRVALQGKLKIARAKAGRQQATVVALSEKISALQRQIAVKAAEMDAELNGLGSSRVRGRGPAYRKLSDEAAAMQSALRRFSAERTVVKAQHDQLAAAIPGLERKIADRIGAERRLFFNAKGLVVAEGQQERAARLAARKANALSQIDKLRSAHQQFESEPSSRALATLQSNCLASLDALKSEARRSAPNNISTCEASGLLVKATPVIALKEGLRKLGADCQGQYQKARGGDGFEAEVAMARQCIIKSGLLPARTASVTAKLDMLERERDDKAHRFVVSMNAFLDGNKLAFLAAGIALAIDLLVLVSGLLGALALRPRVLNVAIPSENNSNEIVGDRHGELARVLRLALRGAPHENAARVLKYIEPAELESGIGMKIEIANVAIEDQDIVRQFLNAGTAFAQVYSATAQGDAVGICSELYLVALEQAGQPPVRPTGRNDAVSAPSATVTFKQRARPPAEAVMAPVLPAPSNPNTAQRCAPAQPKTALVKPETDKVVKAPLSPNVAEQGGQPAENGTPVGGAAEADLQNQPKQAAAPLATEDEEAQLVSVTNGNFKFDY